MSSQAPQSFSNRSACARPAHLRNPTPPPSSAPPAKTRPPAPERPPALQPRPSNPHRSSPPNQPPSFPRFPPSRAFGRRPQSPHDPPQRGRRPKPFPTSAFPSAERAVIRESAAACHASSPPSRMESRCWPPSASPSADGPAAVPLAVRASRSLKWSPIGLEHAAIWWMSDKDAGQGSSADPPSPL